MSSEFEKFIRKNRDDFDDAVPPEKVWQGIEKTLPVKKEAKRFTLRDIYKWSAAAPVFFVAVTVTYFLVTKKYSHENSTVKERTEEPSPRLDNFNSVAIEFAAQFKQAT